MEGVTERERNCLCVCGRVEGVQIGVSTELLMRHVWGEGVTSSSKRPLARRAVSLKECARLPLSLTVPLNDVKQEREGEVKVKCHFACSLMSLLLDAREESTRKEQQEMQAGSPPPHYPLSDDVTLMNALTCETLVLYNVECKKYTICYYSVTKLYTLNEL